MANINSQFYTPGGFDDDFEKKYILLTKEIEQKCGKEPKSKELTHYHFNFLNIFLIIVIVVLGIVLLKNNKKIIEKLKNNFILIIFILLIFILIISLSVREYKINRFKSRISEKFFYSTVERLKDVKYDQCKTQNINEYDIRNSF